MPFNIAGPSLNPALSEEGVWVPLSMGGQVKVARWRNAKARALMTRLLQEYRRARPGRPRIVNNYIPPEVTEEVQLEVVVSCILLDWREFMDGEEEFPYSPEHARWLLSQERFRPVYDEIIEASQDEELFRMEALEEDKKNSARTWNGASATATAKSISPDVS